MKQTQLQLKLRWKRKRSRLGLVVSACFSSGNTFWCQCGECFARDRRQDCVCCFDYVERVEKVHSLSVERLHVDLQLPRSTCHCLHAFSFSYLFWTALRDFFDMTKCPLNLPQQQVSGNLFFFRHLRFFAPSMEGSFTIVFFLQIFAVSGSDWSRRAATQQTSSKFLVPRKSMKAHAILSMLVVLVAAESATEDRFQRRAPSNSVDCVTHAIRSIVAPVQKPWNCQLAERQTRRVDVFFQNLPHVRNSESRFTFTCLLRWRFLSDRRPTTANRKLEICATRATNKVHIDE